MKDRLLGMSLSYDKIGDSLIDPLVREEVYFQGDAAMTSYVSVDEMPFHVISASGFENQRSVTENTSPTRIQNRELTVYLRTRDRDMDINAVLGKYLDAMSTERYLLEAASDPFYVPSLGGGRGMINLTLFMGDGTPYRTKRFQARVSIKSLTGDIYQPSNNLYVLVMTMHDGSFIRYDDPYRIIWDLPFATAFKNVPYVQPLLVMPEGITSTRLTRPRITIEATAVPSTTRNVQTVNMASYHTISNPNNPSAASYASMLSMPITADLVVNPVDDHLNVGETASVSIHDPLISEPIYRSPRYPSNSTPSHFFGNGGYSWFNVRRGFEYLNYPISDGATTAVNSVNSTMSGNPSAADVKVYFDFFDVLHGVVL